MKHAPAVPATAVPAVAAHGLMAAATTVPPLSRLSEFPYLCVQPTFLSADEATALAALARNDAALAQAGVTVQVDETGRSAELPLSLHPLLAVVAQRLDAVLGVDNHLDTLARAAGSRSTLRLRHYRVGEGHPPHVDSYEFAGAKLVATALICLEAPAEGGETVFLAAAGGPLAVAPVAGQLLCWRDVDADGDADISSEHLALPVQHGDKIILAWFVYAEPATWRARAGAALAASRAPEQQRQAARARQPLGALRGLGRLLAVIDDGVPKETVNLIAAAAEARGVAWVRVDPRRFDFSAGCALRPGDLLYRPAVSMHAIRVEQHLWRPEVGSFYLDAEGPYFSNINALATFSAKGLPVPRTFPLYDGDRDLLRRYTEQLGGPPVVLKALGHSRGVGTIRADSLASLFSIVDYALAEGTRPLLTAWVPDAVHWRLVVVGDRVASSYRNVMDADDFRTSGSSDADDYVATPPEGAAELAIAACQALRHAHGGVDILQHPSGRLYLLEANFPCYYATGQLEAGHDVAGAMVDWLLDAAAARAPASPEPWPDLG